MKYADIVLVALIAGSLAVISLFVAVGVAPGVAVGLAAVASLVVIFHALFVNPPTDEP